MDNEYLLNFLKEKNVPIIQKKRHTYLRQVSSCMMVVNSTFLISIHRILFLY